MLRKSVWDNQDVLLETDDGGTTQVAYTVSPALYGEVLAQRTDNTSHFRRKFSWCSIAPRGTQKRPAPIRSRSLPRVALLTVKTDSS